jgi:hypothetical protein
MDDSGPKIPSTRVTEMSGSALRKYMDRAVGSSRYRDLLVYELTNTFLRGFPGALGIFLRRMAYRRLFGAFGKKSVVFEGVVFRCPRPHFHRRSYGDRSRSLFRHQERPKASVHRGRTLPDYARRRDSKRDIGVPSDSETTSMSGPIPR